MAKDFAKEKCWLDVSVLSKMLVEIQEMEILTIFYKLHFLPQNLKILFYLFLCIHFVLILNFTI